MVDAAATATATATTIGTNLSMAKAGAAGPRNKIKKSTPTKHGQAEVVAAVAELAAEEEKMMSGGGGVEVDYFGGDQAVAAAAEVDRAEDWRTWVRPEGLVDEQMSWGAVWYSFWEVDGSENCHAFYGDVLEEDDIWDLRSIKHAPT